MVRANCHAPPQSYYHDVNYADVRCRIFIELKFLAATPPDSEVRLRQPGLTCPVTPPPALDLRPTRPPPSKCCRGGVEISLTTGGRKFVLRIYPHVEKDLAVHMQLHV